MEEAETMSNLSQEEITAGISRAAIAKIQRNGKPPATLAEHLAARAETGVTSVERLYIVDTYDRAFDIVNLDGFRFRIRDLRRQDSAIYCVELAIDRPELERLIQQATKMLQDSPAPKSLKARNDR